MKKLKLSLIGLCFMLVFLAGCQSSVMRSVEPVDLATIDNNMAMVTFVRSSWMGKAIQFGIWDSDKFIGVLGADSFIQYKTTPGKHLFMARAENWACVEAELEGGKSYFILATARMGAWKAGVVLNPVNKEDDISEKKINGWLTRLSATAIDPTKADTYATPRMDQVRTAVDNINQGKGTCKPLMVDDFR